MTNQQINSMSDLAFAAHTLQGVLDKLSNPNTPRAAKLRMGIREITHLDTLQKTDPKDYYSVRFTDAEGHSLQARELPWFELERIGKQVARGVTRGEIYHTKEIDNND